MALSASADDRHVIHQGDHIVLIVEDDAMFASVLLELARERGFKGLIAQDGAGALALAHRYKPHAITLDIGLPDMDGWALLDLLKNDPRTRHIPIHVISVNDEKKRGLKAGAFGFLEKPVDREGLLKALERSKEFITRPVRDLLLVEDDDNQRASITALLERGGREGFRRGYRRVGARGSEWRPVRLRDHRSRSAGHERLGAHPADPGAAGRR